MIHPLLIGGQPPVVLRADPELFDGPGFVEATVLPGRGMMILQARLRLPDGRVVDGLAAPEPAEAARRFGGPEDFAGNASFRFGGAILAPYANRIRGAAIADSREIATSVAGFHARLPRNWGGAARGAEQYAMHGLILKSAIPFTLQTSTHLTGRLHAGGFGGRWPGRTRLDIEWTLHGGALRLEVRATNTSDIAIPVGLGWHPYFSVTSGDRARVRLSIPATARVDVNNYDEVLPTGELTPLSGSDYDFHLREGRPLGAIYLDDCFTRFEPGAPYLAELRDPARGLGLQITSQTPSVRALQVYAPPTESYVVIEPQFNLANPFGPEWRGQDTGMVMVEPGAAARYEVTVTPFAL